MDRDSLLSDYPFVRVRLACSVCPRRGSYRLARLAAKFGAEITILDLVDRLSTDCPARGVRNRGGVICGAHLVDLGGPTLPPDLPPAMMKLRVVRGGKC